MKRYYVYILASRPRGATYIGMTNDLDRRMAEHAQPGYNYASKWNIAMLVYYEEYQFVDEAIAREKELKKWYREWKYQLVETMNPNWEDLSEGN